MTSSFSLVFSALLLLALSLCGSTLAGKEPLPFRARNVAAALRQVGSVLPGDGHGNGKETSIVFSDPITFLFFHLPRINHCF
tara:strand:- start:340 stop:585 length:246 start_codon:yes stop_codon:yes gene_type:complete